MKKLILILILLFTTSISFSAEYVSFCYDKESWKDWDKLVQNNLHNMDIQRLHAIRIGFCKKIEDGTITFEVARDAFNHLHETVFQRTKKEQEQRKRNKEL